MSFGHKHNDIAFVDPSSIQKDWEDTWVLLSLIESHEMAHCLLKLRKRITMFCRPSLKIPPIKYVPLCPRSQQKAENPLEVTQNMDGSLSAALGIE